MPLRILSLGGALVIFCLIPVMAQAKETPAGLDSSALQSLARDFVNRIGGKLKAYDEQEARKADLENPLSQVPDNELLLLRPKANKFVMDTDLAAIKHDGMLYYSLQDIISILELAIEYDSDKKIGSGWFLREDWLIRFDFNKGEVVARGKDYKISPDQIYQEDNDIYISADAARQWMAVDLEPDIPQQYLGVKTPIPFPALARNYRTNKVGARNARNVAVLPRYKAPDKMLDINTLETQENVRWTKRRDAPSDLTHQNTTTIEGEVLKHNLYATSVYDGEEKLTNVTARLTKEDEDAVLLGPLKARYYGMGDVDITNIPLTGGMTQELGVRINNNPLRNADFQSTTISGDSLPGWDVELYRDGGLVDRVRVEDDSRYEFPDIQLFAGDNLFEVFFYGPQGEIRRDSFNIPVNEEFLATQDGTYDVSLTMQDAELYSKYRSDDEDANTPNLIARYNKYIGNTLAYGGLRATQVDGEQKVFIAGGLTNIWKGFIFDLNLATDEQANTASEFNIRKNIDDWRLFFGINRRDEDYITGGADNSLFGVTTTASKNFNSFFDTYTNLTTSLRYEERTEDTTALEGGLTFSTQMGRLNLTDSTFYRKTETGGFGGGEDTRIDKTLSARYSMGKFYLRAGVDYNIQPLHQVEKYFSQISYQPTRKLATDLLVEHDPEIRFTEARLNVNYKHDKFRISPYVSVDTDHKVQTGVRVTTALIDQPGKNLPLMTSDRVVGRGLVSAFVYHDKNGNNVFDGNDEPLPDVIVESVNVTRREKTNEKGYSLIKDLPENFLTDIRVDKATLPDPFMIPGFKGVSIFPRAGQIVELSFPIHVSGEIDGTILVDNKGETTEGSRTSVQLIPVDGKSSKILSAYTATDGYYVISNIPPGNYLLGVNADDAAKLKAGGTAPRSVKIGYDGTVLTQDFELQKGRIQVPIELETYKGTDYQGPFFAMDTANVEGRSTLAVLLEKMVERKSNIQAAEGLVPIAMEGHENLKVLPGQDWNAHYDRCQALNDRHIPCKVILFVPENSQEATQTAEK